MGPEVNIKGRLAPGIEVEVFGIQLDLTRDQLNVRGPEPTVGTGTNPGLSIGRGGASVGVDLGPVGIGFGWSAPPGRNEDKNRKQ